MTSKCNHLAELLKVQETIIRADVDGHKWLRGIEDTEQGIIDFICYHGVIMRQVYCGFACSERENCDIAKEYLPKEVKLYDATKDPDVVNDFERFP